jgi:hypothetical protein
MAGTRKKVDVSQQPPVAAETPQERRARQAEILAGQQARLREEAEARRLERRRREAAAGPPVDS